MVPQFIRTVREKEDKEILLNLNSISKIEIEYIVPGQNRLGSTVGLRHAAENSGAVKRYKVFVGNEAFVLAAGPGSPVMKVFNEIHKNAIRGN